MKIFTKIILTISSALFGIGVICILIAGSMGLTLKGFKQMVDEGKFSYALNDLLTIHIDLNNASNNSYSGQETVEIKDTVTHLEVEYGAGTFTILHGDVEQILIEQKNVKDFEAYVEDKILRIEGNNGSVNSVDTSNATLTITLPRNTTFEFADLEIGASQARITDLTVDVIDIEIGAGQADLTGLVTDKLDITVGAGEANITNLDAQNFNAKVGIGELSASLVGKETDYNCSFDCGIGSVKIGSNSYDGLGTSQTINPQDAKRFIVVDCGIGEVDIDFTE